MLKRASAALLLLTLAGCGGNSYPGPSPTPTPTPSTFTLTGEIIDSAAGDSAAGALISGASVTVIDGPNAGRSGTTNGSGRYTISGLQPGGFTARARAQYYNEASKPVTLTSDQGLNFSLAPIPPFSKSGIGNASFDMPTSVARVRIQATYQGDNQDFVVHIRGSEVVNVTLGTSYIASGTTYDSTQSATAPGTPPGTPSGGPVEIFNSAGVSWAFTEVR